MNIKKIAAVVTVIGTISAAGSALAWGGPEGRPGGRRHEPPSRERHERPEDRQIRDINGHPSPKDLDIEFHRKGGFSDSRKPHGPELHRKGPRPYTPW